MVFIASVTLVVSIFALAMLLGLKRYELTTGRVMVRGVRPGISNVFHATLTFFEYSLPLFVYRLLRYIVLSIKAGVHRTVAYIVLVVEKILEGVLHTVREKTQARRGDGEVSSFLRQVGDHKKELLKRSKGERIIFDD